jgi:hypothetical protein
MSVPIRYFPASDRRSPRPSQRKLLGAPFAKVLERRPKLVHRKDLILVVVVEPIDIRDPVQPREREAHLVFIRELRDKSFVSNFGATIGFICTSSVS